MRDPDRTRAQILKYASKEFAAKGFAGARVDEIAKRAHVNKQSLYYHFGTKEGLFRAALESGFQLFREHDRNVDIESKPPEQALAEFISFTHDSLHQTHELTLMLADENRHKGKHLNAERVREINAPALELMETILTRGARVGRFRSGIDPTQFYISLMSLLIFSVSNVYTLSAVVGADLRSDAAIARRRVHIIDLLLASLRP
jgi:TetR/AcrR family transcriptional regulator